MNRFKNQKELLFFFLDGSKRYFIYSVICVFLLVLFDLVNPKIIGYTVDFIIGDETAIPEFLLTQIYRYGEREFILDHIWVVSIAVILLALFSGIGRYLYKLFTSMGAEKLIKKMRDELYDHISHLPFSWHDTNKTGDIIQRCTSDTDMVKKFISEQLTNLVRAVVLITLALIFMLRIHIGMAMINVVFVPLIIVRSVLFHNTIGNAFQKCDEEEGRLSAIVQENLTGVRVVRAFGREKYERERFEEKNEAYTKLWIDMMYILGNFWVTTDILCGLQAIIVLAAGSYLAVHGLISAGGFVAFLAYNTLLIFPVRMLGRLISEMSKAGVSLSRIMEIMNAEIENDHKDAVDFPEDGDIIFDQVSFSYDSEPVLDHLSMTIKKGQTVGILGGTGSGKSTLVHLLDGFYELNDNQGLITIGGIDIRNIKKSELRGHIGMVLQEPYLFSRSIEDNIRISVKNAEHEDVLRAARTASLDRAVEKFSDGYGTYVGERGVTLSGGQKQRTAIAQMLIRKPDIMIFDDSLSAVDAQTDSMIRNALKKEIKDATVILISHRITTLMASDQIYVLEKGRILQHGTHEELIMTEGEYKRIYDLQVSQGEE